MTSGSDPYLTVFDPATIRLRLARLADKVAATYDQVAGTYDLLAKSRPHDAARLHARAARARSNAQADRDLAAWYRPSLPDAPRPAGPDILMRQPATPWRL